MTVTLVNGIRRGADRLYPAELAVVSDLVDQGLPALPDNRSVRVGIEVTAVVPTDPGIALGSGAAGTEIVVGGTTGTCVATTQSICEP